jgi:FkbM family methyltransferase
MSKEFDNSSIVDEWNAAKGDQTYRLNYPLDSKSFVFDVGAYKGKWADAIIRLYSPIIFLFEPVAEQFDFLKGKYKSSEKITVLKYGLAGSNREAHIKIEGNNDDSASAYGNFSSGEKICLKKFSEAIEELDLKTIDLMKINIEGLEYELLEEMIYSDTLKCVKHLQIQFHSFVEDSEKKRELIRRKLYDTYNLKYDYPFVWEGWSKK